MAENPSTAAILDALHATRTSARERQTAVERQIREEARKIRGGGGGAGSARAAAAEGAAANRHVVDLEGLAFAQVGATRSWGPPVARGRGRRLGLR
jgi:pre-mRNA-splicing helicase BRR2